MSGFEMAGVVLGGIPLVIEALKFYRDGIGTIRDMFKYRDTFDIIYVEFSTNLCRFMQESENLYCKELEMPDHRYKEFITDGGKAWDQDSRTDLERKFRNKLGDDWETYIQLSGYLRKKLNLLRKKLDLNEDFSVPFVVDDGNSKAVDKLKCADFFTISRRVKGGLRKGYLKTLVSEIGNDVEKLGRLTRCAIELEPIRHQQAKQSLSTGASKYWFSVRSHASHLYEALSRVWPQNCTPSHTHCAQLRLDLPNQYPLNEDVPNFCFSFFLEGSGSAPTTLPWTRRDVRMLSLPELAPSTPTSQVQFALPNIRIDSPQASNNVCPVVQEVDDLCSALGKPCCKSMCLGSFVHEQRRYHIHEDGSQCTRKLHRLQHIFSRKSRKGLRPNERTAMAYALASAVLQLYDTPWLKTTWDLDDLYFKPSGNSYELVVVETFGYVPSGSCSNQQNISKRIHPFVRNRTLYSLGVAFLELANGQRLADCETDEDLGEDGTADALTPYRTVERLFQELQEDERESNFLFAVSCCINPRSDSNGPRHRNMDFSLTNDKFRQFFYDDVVIRLREDYEAVFSAGSSY